MTVAAKGARIRTATMAAVIALGLVALLSVPLQHGRLTGRLTSVMSTGRVIYLSLFANRLADASDSFSAWPQSDGTRHQSGTAYLDSTGFFRWCVTSGLMNVHISLLGGNFLSPDESVDLENFRPEDNVWSIVVDVNRTTPDGAPVLITSNVAVSNTRQLTGPICDTLTNVPPLGLSGVVVMQNGGSGFVLSGRRLDETWESVLGGYDPGELPVLRP